MKNIFIKQFMPFPDLYIYSTIFKPILCLKCDFPILSATLMMKKGKPLISSKLKRKHKHKNRIHLKYLKFPKMYNVVNK